MEVCLKPSRSARSISSQAPRERVTDSYGADTCSPGSEPRHELLGGSRGETREPGDKGSGVLRIEELERLRREEEPDQVVLSYCRIEEAFEIDFPVAVQIDPDPAIPLRSGTGGLPQREVVVGGGQEIDAVRKGCFVEILRPSDGRFDEVGLPGTVDLEFHGAKTAVAYPLEDSQPLTQEVGPVDAARGTCGAEKPRVLANFLSGERSQEVAGLTEVVIGEEDALVPAGDPTLKYEALDPRVRLDRSNKRRLIRNEQDLEGRHRFRGFHDAGVGDCGTGAPHIVGGFDDPRLRAAEPFRACVLGERFLVDEPIEQLPARKGQMKTLPQIPLVGVQEPDHLIVRDEEERTPRSALADLIQCLEKLRPVERRACDLDTVPAPRGGLAEIRLDPVDGHAPPRERPHDGESVRAEAYHHNGRRYERPQSCLQRFDGGVDLHAGLGAGVPCHAASGAGSGAAARFRFSPRYTTSSSTPAMIEPCSISARSRTHFHSGRPFVSFRSL